MRSKLVVLFLILAGCFLAGSGEVSANDKPELVVCSQNLNNFGLIDSRHKKKHKRNPYRKKRKRHKDKPAKQLSHLVERFNQAGCDIIAAQEVTGENPHIAKGRLSIIANKLSKLRGVPFAAQVGDSRDRRIRNGFIYNAKKIEVIDLESYARKPIPKLEALSPLRYYSRGPFVLVAKVKPGDGKPIKEVAIVNVHFKSKADSYKDPSKTKFELRRMEMAEGARKLADKYENEDRITLIAGDLNSRRNSSSAEILAGERVLDDFRRSSGCRVDKDLSSDCGRRLRSSSFVRLFDSTLDRGRSIGAKGSFRYKGMFEQIDEILISDEDLKFVQKSDKSLNVGLSGVFGKGSDHKLLWTKLNW